MEYEEAEAYAEIMAMTHEQLDKVTYNKLKWTCCVAGCDRYTRVKDYGVRPYYYWRKKWTDISDTLLYCQNHYRKFKIDPKSLDRKPAFSGLTHLELPPCQDVHSL